MSAPENVPVVLLHGWAGSFAETWQQTGVDALLADAGRHVVGMDLLGHGSEAKPHDPAEYADLDGWLLARLAGIAPVVDAVGFSLGALTLLGALAKDPSRFRRVVLSGIGDGVFRADAENGGDRILAALEGREPPDDPVSRAFKQHASKPWNDPRALAAVLRRPRPRPIDREILRTIDNPVMVAIGDNDFAAPADELAAAFPNGRLITLRRTDHFATPESFSFIDSLLDFLA